MPRWSSFDVAADRQLVHRLNEGDDNALAALYDAYAERLYDYVLSITGEYKATADIVHDTFIDACRRAPRMRDHVRLRSWLYGAARRRCVQRGRGRALYWEPDLDFGGTFPASEGRARPDAASPPGLPSTARPSEPEAETADARELPSSAELRRLLEASLARLEFGDQEVLLLAVRHGLLPAEAGIVLGISARRAAARVARSRSELETAYETELRLATELCVAGRRPAPAVDVADAEAELAERAASLETVVGEAAAKQPAAPEREAAGGAETPPAADAPGRSRRAVAVLPARPRRSSRPSRRPARAARRRGASSAAAGTRRSAGLRNPGPPGPMPTPGGQADHQCEDCERRAGVHAAEPLALAPSPVTPAALRYRVIHTATDPELAGYRADIAARGGGLTPRGLPSQPDMPSPFTRRWLFCGGGMAGALVTALLAALMMGPGLGNPTIDWPPFHARPQPSISDRAPEPRDSGHGREKGPSQAPPPAGPGIRRPARPQQDRATPSPSTPSSPVRPVPPKPGTLTVSPARVEMYGIKSGSVRVTALRGPVTWSATSSSAQVSVSRPRGDLEADGTAQVALTLRTGLIGLPGQATVTFTAPETGAARQVTVVWGASLL